MKRKVVNSGFLMAKIAANLTWVFSNRDDLTNVNSKNHREFIIGRRLAASCSRENQKMILAYFARQFLGKNISMSFLTVETL